MNEARRVFLNRYWIGALLCALLTVIWLYLQGESNDGTVGGARLKADLYNELLHETTEMEADEAIEFLHNKESTARRDSILGAWLLLRETNPDLFVSLKDHYYEQYGDVALQAETEGLPVSLQEAELTSQLSQTLIQQYEHQLSYPDELQAVQENAKQLSGISIFNQGDSFSSRNIRRTATDFARLNPEGLQVGPDLPITSLFSSSAADYAVLVLLLILVYSLMQERKRGLWTLVHATPDGRSRLAARRIGLLFAGAAQAVLLLHGGKALASLCLYRSWGDLGRSLQSIAAFKHIPLSWNLGQALCALGMYKLLSAFLVALCLWVLMSAMDNLNLGLGISAVFLALEYVLYTLIRDNARLVPLRFLNIFAYVDPQRILSTYLNVNLLGQAVPGIQLTVVALPLLTLALGAAAVLIQSRKYPIAAQVPILNVLDRFKARRNSFTARGGMLQYELYKILFVHKGWVIILVLLWYEWSQAGVPLMPPGSDAVYVQSYRTQYAGVIDADTLQKITDERERILAEMPAADDSDLPAMVYSQEAMQLSALGIVEAEAMEIQAVSERQGVVPYLFNDSAYRALLGRDQETYRYRSALRLILAVVLLLSPVYAYEREMNLSKLNRSTPDGRAKLWRRKSLASYMLLLVLWLISCGIELYRVTEFYGPLLYPQAPIQTLVDYRNLTVNVSLGQYLFCIYMLRLLSIFVLGSLVLLLSEYSDKRESALVANTIAWVGPPSVVYIGVRALTYVSFLPALSVVEQWGVFPWYYAILALIGGLVSWFCYQHFCLHNTGQAR